MRLDPDCIRDILLTVEENTGFAKYMTYKDNSSYDLLNKYSFDKVSYHIEQCKLSNFLIGCDSDLAGNWTILNLSPLGHQFLADIRSDNNWNKTKSIAKTVGSSSLSALKEIASNVIAEIIKSQF